MKHVGVPTMSASPRATTYYDASRRISVLQLRLYSAIESRDVLAVAVACVRHAAACWDPRLQVSFWRGVLAKGMAETLADGIRGAFDAMIDEQLPAEKEAR